MNGQTLHRQHTLPSPPNAVSSNRIGRWELWRLILVATLQLSKAKHFKREVWENRILSSKMFITLAHWQSYTSKVSKDSLREKKRQRGGKKGTSVFFLVVFLFTTFYKFRVEWTSPSERGYWREKKGGFFCRTKRYGITRKQDEEAHFVFTGSRPRPRRASWPPQPCVG